MICCRGELGSRGCTKHHGHVPYVPEFGEFDDFVRTSRGCTAKVFALDTESIITTRGYELASLTLLDFRGGIAYQTLVKPGNDVIDYNTR